MRKAGNTPLSQRSASDIMGGLYKEIKPSHGRTPIYDMQRLHPSDRFGLRTIGVAQYFVGLADFAPLNETPFP
jgi:hypothetical protein